MTSDWIRPKILNVWRRKRRHAQSYGLGLARSAFFAAAVAVPATVGAADQAAPDDVIWNALEQVPSEIDASPLPNYAGEFISVGAAGTWHVPAGLFAPLLGSTGGDSGPRADCSPQAIVHYAKQAPRSFKSDQKGLLYGVRTHTPATRMTTRYWDMPGFNSCALVVHAILKRAGCSWARYSANAKAVYDMAYKSGWRPSSEQRAGCLVAWNSRWEGGRRKIGARQKQTPPGTTAFRHVGVAVGSWLSVDNNSWLSRPATFLTFRPISYQPPIFLCPPQLAVAPVPAKSGGKK